MDKAFLDKAKEVGAAAAYAAVYGEHSPREMAQLLIAVGLSKQAVADMLGYSWSSVDRWTNPEALEKQREYQKQWQREHRRKVKSGEKQKSSRSIRKEAEQRRNQ